MTFSYKRYVGRGGHVTTFRMLLGWGGLVRAWHLAQVRSNASRLGTAACHRHP